MARLDPAARDRALGALVGLAVGDALGTPLEFSRRDTKPPVTGMRGGGPFGLEPGQWTDDTSMALCVILAANLGDDTDTVAAVTGWSRASFTAGPASCRVAGATLPRRF